MRSDLIDIDARLVRETDKAWCLDTGSDDDVWLPKSQCEFDQTDGTLTLPEWLAKEKGLI